MVGVAGVETKRPGSLVGSAVDAAPVRADALLAAAGHPAARLDALALSGHSERPCA